MEVAVHAIDDIARHKDAATVIEFDDCNVVRYDGISGWVHRTMYDDITKDPTSPARNIPCVVERLATAANRGRDVAVGLAVSTLLDT